MVTIPTIDQISGTTVMNKMRSLVRNYIEFAGEVGNTVDYIEEVVRNLPQDLQNYYTKSESDVLLANKVTGSGSIGDDTHPVKIVNGQAVAVAKGVLTDTSDQYITNGNIFLTQTGSFIRKRDIDYLEPFTGYQSYGDQTILTDSQGRNLLAFRRDRQYNTYDRMYIAFFKPSATVTDSATLELRINNDNTVILNIRKEIDGVTTVNAVATL